MLYDGIDNIAHFVHLCHELHHNIIVFVKLHNRIYSNEGIIVNLSNIFLPKNIFDKS